MEDLATDSEDNSTEEHHCPDILQSTKTVNGLPDDTDCTGNDQHDPRAHFVDHDTANQGDNDVGKCIKRIKKVELGLTHFGWVVNCVVFANVGLEGLDRERSTEGVSKQYSQPNTTRQAMRRATYLSLVFL